MAPRLVMEGAPLDDEEDPSLAGIEVVELGSPSRARRAARPLGGEFLAPPVLDTGSSVAGGFLTQAVSDGIGALATVVGAPLDLVGAGVGAVIDGLSSAISLVPWVGPLVAEVLVAGKTIIGMGLALPETLLRAVSTLMGSFGKLPEDKQKALTKLAMDRILVAAGQRGTEDQVRRALIAHPPTTSGGAVVEPPGSGPSPLAAAVAGAGAVAAVGAVLWFAT